MNQAKELTSWAGLGKAVNHLAAAVEASDFRPDCILAVTRGGLMLGGALGYRMDIKDVQTVNVEFYTGSGLDDVQLPEPRLLPPGLDLENLRGKRVLIADDVADSGTTLSFLGNLLSTAGSEYRSAVWYVKASSRVTPDFFAARTDRWIVFPWSPFATEVEEHQFP